MAALTDSAMLASTPLRIGRAFLRSYAAVLFSRSHAVGLLLLLATATAPRALIGGAFGVLLALAAASLLSLDREAIKDGSYGAGALLLGLGIGQTLGIGTVQLALMILMMPLCVLLTAALRSLFGGANLPPLSLPFLLMFYLLLGVLPSAGLSYSFPASDNITVLPSGITDFLRSVGAIFFLPRCDAGALLLIALLLHSRIAALLAGMAALAICALKFGLPGIAGSDQFGILTLNAVFTAIAIGGVWFVPSPSAMILALLGVLLCSLITLGASESFYRLGLPILITPFNLSVLIILLATRQRAWDQNPKSVDFTPGTPEENLAYFRTRLLRFRWLYPTRFCLPVRGTWTCTQGTGGPLSHQGRFRHAFDFEVQGEGGKLHSGQGTALKDYHAYRLPVLAAAAGKVVKVENAIPDNECGTLNLEQNWGNHVIIQHASELYSMVAHLQRGSIKVVEGQSVRQGELLGLCGNSGRSPRPHLHFQLQRGSHLGDATLPCRFTDSIVDAGAKNGSERVSADLCPVAGQSARNLEYDEDRAAFFVFPYHASWHFVVREDGRESSVQIDSDIDANGQLQLCTSDRSAALFYSLSDGFFTTYDSAGTAPAALQILRAALSRVPLDSSDTLRWTDFLPARPFRGAVLRVLSDLLSPFLQRDGIEMEYRMHREGASLIVQGESLARDGQTPLLATRAELVHGRGPLRASITLRGRSFTLERESVKHASSAQPGRALAATSTGSWG